VKIFGIGLNKTGTTTLARCLGELGFSHTSCNLKLTRNAVEGNLTPIYTHADQFESFEDWPWPLVYKEMDERYDDAVFILTRRKTPEVWFESLQRHSLRTGPTEFRSLVYGHEMPQGHKEEHIRMYNDHNDSVRRHFRGRTDKLLEVCWAEGHGWEELCGFLSLAVPDVEFPHANKGRGLTASILSYLRKAFIYSKT